MRSSGRNYGANHFIVGRDHASPGVDENGQPFYGHREAVELVKKYSDELGIDVMSFEEMVYIPDDGITLNGRRSKKVGQFFSLSGAAVRNEYLNNGQRPPEWFMRPEVADILRETYPAKDQRGVCIWFTGLSWFGKIHDGRDPRGYPLEPGPASYFARR
jgi:sulfate adenylyltransferase